LDPDNREQTTEDRPDGTAAPLDGAAATPVLFSGLCDLVSGADA
jgi:hypothetical protein